MDYRRLLLRLKGFIHNMETEWRKVAQELVDNEKDAMHPLNQFALPFIGLAAICSFIGIWIHSSSLDFRFAVASGGFTFISLYLGILFSSYLYKRLIYPAFKIEKANIPPLQLSGYSSIVVILTFAITSLLPGTFFLSLLCLAIFYPLLACTQQVLNFPPKENKISFVFLCAFIAIASPLLIKILLTMLAKYIIL